MIPLLYMEAICVYHIVHIKIFVLYKTILNYTFLRVKLFPSNLSLFRSSCSLAVNGKTERKNIVGKSPTLRKCTNHGRSVQHFGSRKMYFLSMGIGCGGPYNVKSCLNEILNRGLPDLFYTGYTLLYHIFSDF